MIKNNRFKEIYKYHSRGTKTCLVNEVIDVPYSLRKIENSQIRIFNDSLDGEKYIEIDGLFKMSVGSDIISDIKIYLSIIEKDFKHHDFLLKQHLELNVFENEINEIVKKKNDIIEKIIENSEFKKGDKVKVVCESLKGGDDEVVICFIGGVRFNNLKFAGRNGKISYNYVSMKKDKTPSKRNIDFMFREIKSIEKL